MLEDILEKNNELSNDAKKEIEELTIKNRELNHMLIESDYTIDNLVDENVELVKENNKLKETVNTLKYSLEKALEELEYAEQYR